MSTMATEGNAATAISAARSMFEDKGRQALPAGVNRTAASHHHHQTPALVVAREGGCSGNSSTGIAPRGRLQAKPQADHVAMHQLSRTPVHGGFHMQATAAAIATAAAAAAAASAKQPAPQPVMSKPTTRQGPPPSPKVLAKSSIADISTQSATSDDCPEARWPQPPPEPTKKARQNHISLPQQRPAVLCELQSRLRVRTEQAVLSQAYRGCAAADALPADGEVSGGNNLLPQTTKVALKPPLSPGAIMSTFKKGQSMTEPPTEATGAVAAVGSAEVPTTATAASAAATAATTTGDLTNASVGMASARAMVGTALAERASREQSHRPGAPLLPPSLPVKPPKVPDQAASAELESVAVAGEPCTHKHTEDDHSPSAQGKRHVKVAPPLPSKPFAVTTPASEAASGIALLAAATAAAAACISMVSSSSPSQDGIKVMDSSGAVFALLPFPGNKGRSVPSSKPASILDASDVQLPCVLWADDEMLGSSAQSVLQQPRQQWQAPVTLRKTATSSNSQSSPQVRSTSVVSLIEPTTEAEEYDDCFQATADERSMPLSAPALPSKPGADNRTQPPPPGTCEASTGDGLYDDTACTSAYDDTRSDATQESASTVSSDGNGSTSSAQKEARRLEIETKREMRRREKQEQEQRDREAREQAEEKERRDKEIEKMAKIRQALQKDKDKIRKRLKLSGDETYIRLVTMRSSHTPKPGNQELPYKANDVLYVILKEGCPKGKWLARNSENLMGFISSEQVVQTSVSSEQGGGVSAGDILYDDTGQIEEPGDDDIYATVD